MRRIEGDVEISVDYHNLQSGEIKQGWGSSLLLEVDFDDDYDSRLNLGVGRDSDSKPKTLAQLRRSLTDKASVGVDLDVIGEASDSGVLRMVRHGGRIHCVFATGPDQPFQLLHSMTVGDAAIKSVSVRARGSHKSAELSGEVGELIIRETK